MMRRRMPLLPALVVLALVVGACSEDNPTSPRDAASRTSAAKAPSTQPKRVSVPEKIGPGTYFSKFEPHFTFTSPYRATPYVDFPFVFGFSDETRSCAAGAGPGSYAVTFFRINPGAGAPHLESNPEESQEEVADYIRRRLESSGVLAPEPVKKLTLGQFEGLGFDITTERVGPRQEVHPFSGKYFGPLYIGKTGPVDERWRWFVTKLRNHTVTIAIAAPTEHFESFLPDAEKILESVELS